MFTVGQIMTTQDPKGLGLWGESKGGENPMRIELRADSVILDGYVNVVQRESRLLPSPRGKFVEQIMPRTFERALLNNPEVDLLFNHDKSRKLGSTKQGNLDLREDNIGLRATATVYDKQVMEKAKKGELRGWSFGFNVLKDAWEQRSDGVQKRTVEELHLAEVSILDVSPAYIATSIEARDGEESTLTETRSEEFRAKLEDKTESKDKKEKTAKPNSDKDEEEAKDEEASKKTDEEMQTDDSEKDADVKEEKKKTKKEEKRDIPQSFYFSNLDNELTLLQLRKGL
jgi:uncharacterized protein